MRTRFIRNILILFVCIFAVKDAKAQSFERLDVSGSWSLGFTCGMSDLWGDVGTQSIADHYNNGKYFNSMHFMGGVFGRLAIHPAFAVRLGINYGTVYATDTWNYNKAKNSPSIGTDAVQRYERFQDAKTNIWEGSMIFEIEPLRMNPESNIACRSGQPYLLGGLGYFHFQPYSSYGGSWVKIAPLHLEGDGFPIAGAPPLVNLYQWCVPLGAGYRFDIGPHLNIGIEYQWRMTFTDYLDGVSGKYIDPKYYDLYLSPANAALAKQMADKSGLAFNKANFPAGTIRGNSSDNDSYSTISIILYWKVKPHHIPWWGR